MKEGRYQDDTESDSSRSSGRKWQSIFYRAPLVDEDVLERILVTEQMDTRDGTYCASTEIEFWIRNLD